MAEQLRMGVLRNREPETFVVITLDPESGHLIKRMAFHSLVELRAIFKNLPEGEFDLLIAQLRAHPVD